MNELNINQDLLELTSNDLAMLCILCKDRQRNHCAFGEVNPAGIKLNRLLACIDIHISRLVKPSTEFSDYPSDCNFCVSYDYHIATGYYFCLLHKTNDPIFMKACSEKKSREMKNENERISDE